MSGSRLTRSNNDQIIAGVCGGLAEYLGIDSVWVRLAFLLLIPSGGIGIPLYIVLMLIMPLPQSVDMRSSDVLQENVEKFGPTISSGVERIGGPTGGPLVVAGILIILGLYFLLRNLGVVPGISLGVVGPLLLLVIGIVVIVKNRR